MASKGGGSLGGGLDFEASGSISVCSNGKIGDSVPSGSRGSALGGSHVI